MDFYLYRNKSEIRGIFIPLTLSPHLFTDFVDISLCDIFTTKRCIGFAREVINRLIIFTRSA